MSKLKFNSLNRSLLLILFFLMASSIPIFYSAQGLTDPFLFWNIAFVQKFLNATHFPLEDVVFSPKYIPGAITMMILLSKISGIPPKTLQFLPIVGIILPVVYYSLSRKFSKSIISASIVTLLMLNLPSPMTFFTIWPHAFGYLLWLIFILLNFHLFRKKDFKILILSIVVFVSIHLYSYTAEMWTLSFSIIMNLLLLSTIFISKSKKLETKLTFNLMIAFLVIFLGFNKILYEHYLPQGRFMSTLLESSLSYFYKYVNFLSSSTTQKYIHSLDSTLVITLLGIFYFILVFSIILIGIVASINKLWRIKRIGEEIYFKFALLLVGLIDLIVYALRGIFTTRYINFVFPLLVLISLKEISFKKISKNCFLLILLSILVVHNALSWQYGIRISNPSKYSELEPSASWFSDHSVQKEALVDLRTGFKYLLESASENTYFESHFISLEEYELLVDPKHISNRNPDLHDISPYVIINKNLRKIQSLEWEEYESFSEYLPEISSNININKIYDDDKIWIFETR